MKCPVCDAQLREIQRYGVEVDICPDCKGVWLDRGELEKIIELEAAGGPPREHAQRERTETRPPEPQPRHREEERYYEDDDDDRRRQPQYDRDGRPIRKKRESWFGEIFDMFGD